MDTIGSYNNANIQDMDEIDRLVHEIWLECSGIGKYGVEKTRTAATTSDDFCNKAERIKTGKGTLAISLKCLL
jgi:hypothetical protein